MSQRPPHQRTGCREVDRLVGGRALQAFEVTITQFGLTRAHVDGATGDPHLFGEAGDFERVAAPEHHVGDLTGGDAAASGAEAEDVSGVGGQRGDGCFFGMP